MAENKPMIHDIYKKTVEDFKPTAKQMLKEGTDPGKIKQAFKNLFERRLRENKAVIPHIKTDIKSILDNI